MKFQNVFGALALGLLSACGGGSDSGESVSLQTRTVVVSAVERNSATGDLAVSVSHPKAGSAIYFELEGGRTVLSDFQPAGEFSDTAHITVTTRSDLSVGSHQETTRLHACLDADCRQEIGGSPMTVVLRADVSANIGVAALTTLARTGADPAPGATIPVTVPAAAGAVFFSPVGTTSGIALNWVDGAVQVTTTQLRAGTYEASGHLAGANPLYFADFTVQYTVNPPAGGEHGMSVDVPSVTFALSQGEVKTQRLVVTRPTWTNDYTPLALTSGCDAMYTLTDLGGDAYLVTASAVGLPVSVQHFCTLVASAGDASVGVGLQSNVGLAFGVGGPQGFVIASDTQPAQLQQSLPVTMTDASATAWTASTTAPWLKLARTTGTTGVDALSLAVDPAHLADYLPGATAHVVVGVDRADVPPQDLTVGLSYSAPYVRDMWTTGLKAGGRARLYLNGQFDYNVATNNSLSLTGARLLNTRQVSDSSLLGNTTVLQLDVDQVVPGQAITATLSSPLLATQANVLVAATPAGGSFVAMPWGVRKPASYSPANSALYLAGSDTVWRVAMAGGNWTLSSASLPGVFDVDPRPDEKHLLAVGTNGLSLLDPVSLQPVWSNVPVVDYVGNPAVLSGAADTDSKSVLHSSDGYGWVTYSCAACGYTNARGVAQLSLGYADAIRPAAGIVNLSRGAYAIQRSDGSFATPWMIGSAGRKTVLATSAQATDATAFAGDSMSRVDVNGNAAWYSPGLTPLAWPVAPAGVGDDGGAALRTDGWIWNQYGVYFEFNVATLAPAGQTIGGWGLSGDGQYVLMYTYQLNGAGDTATATLPTLHVIDLFSHPTLVSPAEMVAIPLAGVPGCGSPRAPGETCQHAVHVLLDPSGSLAFVAGPRGVAVAALPAALASGLKVGGRQRAQATPAHPLKAVSTERR